MTYDEYNPHDDWINRGYDDFVTESRQDGPDPDDERDRFQEMQEWEHDI